MVAHKKSPPAVLTSICLVCGKPSATMWCDHKDCRSVRTAINSRGGACLQAVSGMEFNLLKKIAELAPKYATFPDDLIKACQNEAMMSGQLLEQPMKKEGKPPRNFKAEALAQIEADKQKKEAERLSAAAAAELIKDDDAKAGQALADGADAAAAEAEANADKRKQPPKGKLDGEWHFSKKKGGRNYRWVNTLGMFEVYGCLTCKEHFMCKSLVSTYCPKCAKQRIADSVARFNNARHLRDNPQGTSVADQIKAVAAESKKLIAKKVPVDPALPETNDGKDMYTLPGTRVEIASAKLIIRSDKDVRQVSDALAAMAYAPETIGDIVYIEVTAYVKR